MNKLITLTFLIILGTSCSLINKNKQSDEGKKLLNSYRSESLELIKMNKAKSKRLSLRKKSSSLINLARPILNKLISENKVCSQFLKQTLSDIKKMKKLSLDKIEELYHDGEALPEMEDETCILGKELVVHPAIVYILTKKKLNSKSREQINEELEEVLSHLDELKI
jgi:hypothetical protein